MNIMYSRQSNIKFITRVMYTIALLLSLYSRPLSAFTPSSSKATFSSMKTMKAPASLQMSRLTATPPDEMSAFQRRMLKLVQTEKKIAVNNKQKSMTPTNVQVVCTLDEYKNVVGMEKERIVVVRFYASWCKSCRAMRPLFYRLANKYKDVSFVDVPVTENNAHLHQGLGVPSVPFGHIYHPEVGLVEEQKISKKFFAQFEEVLETYMNGVCELSDGEVTSPYVTNESADR